MISAFKILGWLEGASFLTLLFVAMPIKYMLADPSWVKMMGPIHGFLFIGYVLLANFVGDELKWSWGTKFKAFLSAVLPFGTFWFEKKYLQAAPESSSQ